MSASAAPREIIPSMLLEDSVFLPDGMPQSIIYPANAGKIVDLRYSEVKNKQQQEDEKLSPQNEDELARDLIFNLSQDVLFLHCERDIAKFDIDTLEPGTQAHTHKQTGTEKTKKPNNDWCEKCTDHFYEGLKMIEYFQKEIKNEDNKERIMHILIIQRTIKSILEQNMDLFMNVLDSNIRRWLINQQNQLNTKYNEQITKNETDPRQKEIIGRIHGYIPKPDKMVLQYTRKQLKIVTHYIMNVLVDNEPKEGKEHDGGTADLKNDIAKGYKYAYLLDSVRLLRMNSVFPKDKTVLDELIELETNDSDHLLMLFSIYDEIGFGNDKDTNKHLLFFQSKLTEIAKKAIDTEDTDKSASFDYLLKVTEFRLAGKYIDVRSELSKYLDGFLNERIQETVHKFWRKSPAEMMEIRKSQFLLRQKHRELITHGAILPDFDDMWDYHLHLERATGVPMQVIATCREGLKRKIDSSEANVWKFNRKEERFEVHNQNVLDVEQLVIMMKMCTNEDIMNLANAVLDIMIDQLYGVQCQILNTDPPLLGQYSSFAPLKDMMEYYKEEVNNKLSDFSNLLKLIGPWENVGNCMCLLMMIDIAMAVDQCAKNENGYHFFMRGVDELFRAINNSGNDKYIKLFDYLQLYRIFKPEKSIELGDGIEAFGVGALLSSGKWFAYESKSVTRVLMDRKMEILDVSKYEQLVKYGDPAPLFYHIMKNYDGEESLKHNFFDIDGFLNKLKRYLKAEDMKVVRNQNGKQQTANKGQGQGQEQKQIPTLNVEAERELLQCMEKELRTDIPMRLYVRVFVERCRMERSKQTQKQKETQANGTSRDSNTRTSQWTIADINAIREQVESVTEKQAESLIMRIEETVNTYMGERALEKVNMTNLDPKSTITSFDILRNLLKIGVFLKIRSMIDAWQSDKSHDRDLTSLKEFLTDLHHIFTIENLNTDEKMKSVNDWFLTRKLFYNMHLLRDC